MVNQQKQEHRSSVDPQVRLASAGSKEHKNDADRSRSRSAKMFEQRPKKRRKIDENPRQIGSESSNNRFRADSCFQTRSGTRPDAFGTAGRCPKAAPRPILGRLGRPKRAQETSKSDHGPPPRSSRTGPEKSPSAFGASNTSECACGATFRRFCVVTRKFRCVGIQLLPMFCTFRTK